MEWEHLRVFMAVMRWGSVSEAARRLGISQPTAGRHVRALEDRLRARLFERTSGRLEPTAAAADLLALAQPMADAAEAIERRRDQFATVPTGTVRITCGEWMGRFLAQSAFLLQERLPGISLEIAATISIFNLSRREADIAIRNRMPEDGALAVARLPDIAFAAYGARGYVAAHPQAFTQERFAACRWIGFDEPNADQRTARWLEPRLERPPDLRCSSARTQLEAAKAGYGLVLAPCWAAAQEPDLVEIMPPTPDLAGETYLVVHQDTRRVPRVRAVLDALASHLTAERGRLTATGRQVTSDEQVMSDENPGGSAR